MGLLLLPILTTLTIMPNQTSTRLGDLSTPEKTVRTFVNFILDAQLQSASKCVIRIPLDPGLAEWEKKLQKPTGGFSFRLVIDTVQTEKSGETAHVKVRYKAPIEH